MPGITIDTNIYVSALQYGGKPMSLLEAGLDGQVDIAVSQPIIEETLRVLREKFGWNDGRRNLNQGSADGDAYSDHPCGAGRSRR